MSQLTGVCFCFALLRFKIDVKENSRHFLKSKTKTNRELSARISSCLTPLKEVTPETVYFFEIANKKITLSWVTDRGFSF